MAVINRKEYTEKAVADFLDTNFETLRAEMAALSPATTMPVIDTWERGTGRSFGKSVMGFVDCLDETEEDFKNSFQLMPVSVLIFVPTKGAKNPRDQKRMMQRYSQTISDLLTDKTNPIRGITLGDRVGFHDVRVISSPITATGVLQAGKQVHIGFEVLTNLTVKLQTDNVV